jgi:ribosomal subunit interface protein
MPTEFNCQITSLNIEVTPALRDYAEKRLSTLKKYASGGLNVIADIGKPSAHHMHGDVFVAKVTARTPLGQEYYATSEKADLYEAIDDVRDELMRLLTADKKKRDTIWKRGARRIKNIIKGLR